MSGDFSSLKGLSAALLKAPTTVAAGVKRETKRAALDIKDTARRNVQAAITGVFLPHYAASIDFDFESSALGAHAEIGPNAGRPQGGMSVEFGSSRHGPIPHVFPAADEGVPRWVDGLERVAGEIL